MKKIEVPRISPQEPVPDWVFSYAKSGDELGLVLRCQMELESHLDTLLQSMVPVPDRLSKMQLNYFLKVQLALSLGLSDNLEGALRYFGTIRNKFAHKPQQKIGKSEAKNLYKVLPPEVRKMAQDCVSFALPPKAGTRLQWRELQPVFQFFVMWTCIASIMLDTAKMAAERSAEFEVLWASK